MSARSEDNSYFESLDGGWLRRRSDGARMLTVPAFKELLKSESEEVVRQIVVETRSNFRRYFADLLAKIEVPTILFWFSVRSPDYSEGYSSVPALFGDYPQLVDERTMAKLRPLADGYVECVSTRGLPQPLFDRFTGEPTTVLTVPEKFGGREIPRNGYYPSPEMHEDAAAALRESARSMLRTTSPTSA
jgi:hypothetical protein